MSRLRTPLMATVLIALVWCGTGRLCAQGTENPPFFVSLQLSTTPCENPTPWVPFIDECLVETQRLYVCMQIQDLDFNADDEGSDTDQVLLLTMESLWVPFIYNGLRYGPQPPTVPTDRTGRYRLLNSEEDVNDYYTAFPPPEGNISDVELQFVVPQFNGANQARLRGLIGYDVLWWVVLTVRNDATSQDFPPDEVRFFVCATSNPNLAPGNPPPFADAGGDQLVSAGDTVRLDGSRSFDQSNVGFSPFDPETFDKDQLNYTWEWLDGPERVDPQPDPDADPGVGHGQWPVALVTLEVVNTAEKPYYLYRLLVDDGVNTPPSTDEVRIRVIPKVRENRAPSAAISDADGKVVSGGTVAVRVGDEIKLSAQLSVDPDGDPLIYRWRQTNEIGGFLTTDEVLRTFQPLLGLASRDVAWVATEVGTYYFNLLVTDQPPEGLKTLSASTTVTVQVAEAATAAAVAGRASNTFSDTEPDIEESAASAEVPAPAACGSGALLPLALMPVTLWLLRGRRR